MRGSAAARPARAWPVTSEAAAPGRRAQVVVAVEKAATGVSIEPETAPFVYLIRAPISIVIGFLFGGT